MIDSWEATADLARNELVALVCTGNPQERVWAAWRIGLLRDSSTTALLREQVIAAPNPGTRRHLAIVLAGAGATDALKALAEHDPSSYVRRDAAVLWWRCAGDTALPTLERLFEVDASSDVRLGLLEVDPPLPESLLRKMATLALAHSDPALRLAAARLSWNRRWPLLLSERRAALAESDEIIRKLSLARWASTDPLSLATVAATASLDSSQVRSILESLVAAGTRLPWGILEPIVLRVGWDTAALALLARPPELRALISLLDSQRLDLPLSERAESVRIDSWVVAPLLEEAHRTGALDHLPEHHLEQIRNLEAAIEEHDAALDPNGDTFDPSWDEVREERRILAALGRNPGRLDLFIDDD